jgi:PhnB protein
MINIFLNFNGNCREAVSFYGEVFNSTPSGMQLYEVMPESDDFPLTEEDKKRVMYVELEVEDTKILLCDVSSADPVTFGSNMQINITDTDQAKLEGYFDKLKQNGTIIMPFGPTFWSSGYGFVIDKFGVQWMFNTDNE